MYQIMLLSTQQYLVRLHQFLPILHRASSFNVQQQTKKLILSGYSIVALSSSMTFVRSSFLCYSWVVQQRKSPFYRVAIFSSWASSKKRNIKLIFFLSFAWWLKINIPCIRKEEKFATFLPPLCCEWPPTRRAKSSRIEKWWTENFLRGSFYVLNGSEKCSRRIIQISFYL